MSKLLAGVAAIGPALDCVVTGLSIDSRKVYAGDCFLAYRGTAHHGREYIDEAIRAGAIAVLVEAEQGDTEGLPARVPLVTIPNLKSQVGVIADRFYHHPSRELLIIGITGTNGKTSVSHFIARVLNENTKFGPCGVIGTLGYGLLPNLELPTTTTPDAITLHRLLASLRNQGAQSAVLEVSSHGLVQERVSGVEFDLAVFTNLTRDHLDYHGTMEAYREAKRLLFQRPGLWGAVVNLDDAFGQELVATLPSSLQVLGYTLASGQVNEPPRTCPYVRGSVQSITRQGITLQIIAPSGQGILTSKLLGRFNASNLLAALATLLMVGVPLEQALEGLSRAPGVPGRMECFGGSAGKPLVVVDYAHTPDGLAQALGTLREVCSGQIWCVFGCGGERDRGKRPVMGQVAEALADYIVLTQDNPRGETPLSILNEILSGIQQRDRVYIEEDRAKAIMRAVLQAGENDVVLVAGKGHETYQEIRGQRLSFSDRDLVDRITREQAL